MIRVIEKNISYDERIALKVVNTIFEGRKKTSDYLKCKLALELLVINITKICIVYSIAILMGLCIYTLLFHIFFMMIRMYSYGAHFLKSSQCTFWSVIVMVGIPYIVKLGFNLNIFILAALAVLNTYLLYKYAPAVTSKNRLGDKIRQKKLRNKALLANLISVLLLSLSIPLEFKTLIILGNTFASVMVSPIIFKVIKK